MGPPEEYWLLSQRVARRAFSFTEMTDGNITPLKVEFNPSFDLHPRGMADLHGQRLCIFTTAGTKTTRDRFSREQKLANAGRLVVCWNACRTFRNPDHLERAMELLQEAFHLSAAALAQAGRLDLVADTVEALKALD